MTFRKIFIGIFFSFNFLIKTFGLPQAFVKKYTPFLVNLINLTFQSNTLYNVCFLTECFGKPRFTI